MLYTSIALVRTVGRGGFTSTERLPTMFNFIASIVFSLQVNAAPVASACETYAPNLDGIAVTVCAGEVVSRCDASGNCQSAAETY